MPLSKTRRAEIGERVKALRERSPIKGPVLAEKLHVSYRQYQNYERPGPGDFDTCERIAKLHWRLWAKHDPEYGFVSPGWLWDGKDRRQTPDVLQAISGGNKPQLDQIEHKLDSLETKLDTLLRNWDARWALLEVDDAPESSQVERPPSRASSSKGRRARARR